MIDISHEDYYQQEEIVLKTLEEIGIKNKTIWKIYNKCDKLDDVPMRSDDDCFYLSAFNKEGLDDLKNKTMKYILENHPRS